MKKRTKAIRKDVMDELNYIIKQSGLYSLAKREWAQKLRDVLGGVVFDPEVEYLKVIDIHNGHAIDVSVPAGSHVQPGRLNSIGR